MIAHDCRTRNREFHCASICKFSRYFEIKNWSTSLTLRLRPSGVPRDLKRFPSSAHLQLQFASQSDLWEYLSNQYAQDFSHMIGDIAEDIVENA